MKKRLMALMLALVLLWTIPAMADSGSISDMLSYIFNTASQPGVVGRWQVVDFIGNDDMRATIGKVERNGGVMVLTLSEDTMSLYFVVPGDTSGESMYITLEDNAIISNGKPIPYELDGDTLRLVKPEGTMVLRRIGAGSPVGEWEMTALRGSADAEDLWRSMQSANATACIVISDTYMTLTLTQNGKPESNKGPITIQEGVINSSGQMLKYTVEGDTLTIDSSGIIMVFKRLH